MSSSQAPQPQMTVKFDTVFVGPSLRLLGLADSNMPLGLLVTQARQDMLGCINSAYALGQQPNSPAMTLSDFLITGDPGTAPVELEQTVGSMKASHFTIHFLEEAGPGRTVLRDRLAALIQLESTHNQQMAAMTEQLSQHTTIREQLEQRAIFLQAQVAQLKKDMANLGHGLDVMRSDNSQLEDKATELQNQLHQRDQFIETLKQQIAMEKAQRTGDVDAT